MSAKNLSEKGQQLRGKRIKEEIRTLTRLLERANHEALTFADELGAIERMPCFVVGDFWDCSISPFGLCVYDNYEDRAHDNCLFCHAPEERK